MLARPHQRERREAALRQLGELLRRLLNELPEQEFPTIIRTTVDGLSPRERDF
jgi:hypothetical protein